MKNWMTILIHACARIATKELVQTVLKYYAF